MHALKTILVVSLLVVNGYAQKLGVLFDANSKIVAPTNIIFPSFTVTGGQTNTATGRTTARKLEDRFAEVYNIIDYGAAVAPANAYTAIQAAVDAAEAAGGGEVFIPPGTWRTYSTIIVDNIKVTIRGVSDSTILYNYSTGPTIKVTGGYFIIKDISIWGTGAAVNGVPGSTGAVGTHGLWLAEASDYSKVNNANFRYHGGHGIYIKGANPLHGGSSIEITGHDCRYNALSGINSVTLDGNEQNGNALIINGGGSNLNGQHGIEWNAAVLDLNGTRCEANFLAGLCINSTNSTITSKAIHVNGGYYEQNTGSQILLRLGLGVGVYGLTVNQPYLRYGTSPILSSKSALLWAEGAGTLQKTHIGFTTYVMGGTGVTNFVDLNSRAADSVTVETMSSSFAPYFVNLGSAVTPPYLKAVDIDTATEFFNIMTGFSGTGNAARVANPQFTGSIGINVAAAGSSATPIYTVSTSNGTTGPNFENTSAGTSAASAITVTATGSNTAQLAVLPAGYTVVSIADRAIVTSGSTLGITEYLSTGQDWRVNINNSDIITLGATGLRFNVGGILDTSGDLGTAGQVLSSTGTGLNWIAAGGGGAAPAGTGLTRVTAGVWDVPAELSGDVTTAGGLVTTIANNAVTTAKILDANVTLAKQANMATDSIVGRATAAAGVPEVLTALPFAYTGDVTRPADSNVQTIPNDTVTYAKMQNVTAASRLIGRGSAFGAGDPEEITVGANLAFTGTSLAVTGMPTVGANYRIPYSSGSNFAYDAAFVWDPITGVLRNTGGLDLGEGSYLRFSTPPGVRGGNLSFATDSGGTEEYLHVQNLNRDGLHGIMIGGWVGANDPLFPGLFRNGTGLDLMTQTKSAYGSFRALNVRADGMTIAGLTGLLMGNAASPISAVTTSAGISSAISDETGTGALVFATSPTFVTPVLGVASATSMALASPQTVPNGGTGVGTLTGLALGNGTSAFSAVTTSAGISGAISDETGTGALVFANTPTLVTPVIGVATGTSLSLSSALTISNGGTGQTTASAAFDALSPNTTRGDITARGGSGNQRVALGDRGSFFGSDGTDAVFMSPFKRETGSEDFISGLGQWVVTTANSGTANAVNAGIETELGHAGGRYLRSNTTSAAAAAGIYYGINQIMFSDGEKWVVYVFKILTLPTAGEDYALVIGFGDSTSNAEPVDGAYFYCAGSGDVNWQLKTSNNSVRTTQTTSTAVATGWQVAAVKVNAAGTAVSYYHGATFATLAQIGTDVVTNIPTGTTRTTGAQIHLYKIAGTGNRGIYVDLSVWDLVNTTSR